MITLTSYDNSGGNASKILVVNASNISVYDTNGANVTSALLSIISGESTLTGLVGSDYVDILLLACDVPLYSQTDKESF